MSITKQNGFKSIKEVTKYTRLGIFLFALILLLSLASGINIAIRLIDYDLSEIALSITIEVGLVVLMVVSFILAIIDIKLERGNVIFSKISVIIGIFSILINLCTVSFYYVHSYMISISWYIVSIGLIAVYMKQ